MKVNLWSTTDKDAWFHGHEMALPVNGTLEEDMNEAAIALQCGVKSLKFRSVEMTAEELDALTPLDDL